MKFPERIKAIFTKKNLVQKATEKKMTSQDWDAIRLAYKDEYGTDLDEDNAAYQQTLRDAAVGQNVAALLGSQQPVQENASQEANEEGGENTEGAANENAQQAAQNNPDVLAQIQSLITSNNTMSRQINAMVGRAAPDQPQQTGPATLVLSGPGTTATHLYGIQHEMFSLDNRWNRVAANPSYSLANPIISKSEEIAFRGQIEKVGEAISNRFRHLHENGQLNKETLKSLTFTTSDLSSAGLGDQYVVRRQDALIARILEIPNVSDLFNTRYNVQDRELMTNAFFSELTQAFQTGAIFKGGMSLSPEFGHVDDLMIKVEFGSMKEIERMYIGYLNTSGSDPIKWNMIEFAILGLLKQAMNEYNTRKILGIYVKPEANTPGAAINASTGVIYTLLRYYHENKLLLHDDEDLADYDKATIFSVVKEFIAAVLESVTAVGSSLDGFYINLNKNHKSWWISAIRTALGKDTDFNGPDSYANVVPDTDIRIRWIPNMKQLTFMWLEQPGNLQFLENVPGEIYALKMQEFMEQVMVWSNGKEGTTASFVGKPFATSAALAANNFELQQIFMNKPISLLAADATTVDGTKGILFGTIANTAATALTDITGAQKGVAYIIECAATTNASTIAKSGKFSEITEAYTPTAVGDYIMVILNSAGTKFLELERKVAGTRTINTALQPNIPGAR